MTKHEAIAYFGTQAALARALGVNRAAINGWGDKIPPGRQYQLEVITKGRLKAAPEGEPSYFPASAAA